MATANLNSDKTRDRRGHLRSSVESLLERRQRVLIDYCKLAGETSLSDSEESMEKIGRFCQALIDYTALGHFVIYQRIIEGKERRGAVKAVAEKVYPRIAVTTDYLVDFNDKYDAQRVSGSTDIDFESELSRLGEVIGERAELEDQLLVALTT